MSWIDQIKTPFIITTGDGKKYTVLWRVASKAVEYNMAEFDFPGLSGTKADKALPKGRRFDMEFYFQGEDHLDHSAAFEVSSNNRKPWSVQHPLYGIIICHPFGLHFDNSQQNVTRITCTALETITSVNPRTVIDPIDNLQILKRNMDTALTSGLSGELPTITDQIALTENTSKFYNIGKLITLYAAESENYFNLYNTALSSILSATAVPLAALQAIQAAITAPYLFQTSVQARLNCFSSQFEILRTGLPKIKTRSSKKMYEIQGSATIAGMTLSAITPQPGDYYNSAAVLLVIEKILAAYNAFYGNVFAYSDLDNMQSPNGGSPSSYIPDAKSLALLSSLVSSAIAGLFAIALNARQERTIYLEKDTNLILLTHRLYGLDPDDNNINELMKNNDIGLSEILQIKKGRKIVYYI